MVVFFGVAGCAQTQKMHGPVVDDMLNLCTPPAVVTVPAAPWIHDPISGCLPLLVNQLGYEVLVPRFRLSPFIAYADVETVPLLLRTIYRRLQTFKTHPRADQIRGDPLQDIKICTLWLIYSLSWMVGEDPQLRDVLPEDVIYKPALQKRQTGGCERYAIFAERLYNVLTNRLRHLCAEPEPEILRRVTECLQLLRGCGKVLASPTTAALGPDPCLAFYECAFERILSFGAKALPALAKNLQSADVLLRFWTFICTCEILKFRTPLHALLAQFILPVRPRRFLNMPVAVHMLNRETERLLKLRCIMMKFFEKRDGPTPRFRPAMKEDRP